MRAEEEGMLRTFIDTAIVGHGGSHRLWMRTGTPSVRPFSKVSRDQNGKAMYYKCAEVHKAVKCKKPAEKKKAKTLWSLVDFYDLGQRTEDPNKIPSKAGPLGKSI